MDYAYSPTFGQHHIRITKREKKDHNYPDGPSEIPFFLVFYQKCRAITVKYGKNFQLKDKAMDQYLPNKEHVAFYLMES